MTETNISISSGSLTLQGTLDVCGPTPGAAALLISGSGPVDRNSNAKRLSINVMGQIASHLASNNISSLRYDKRGAGQSDGDYRSTGFHDNVEDAMAALEALRARPEVDRDRVVVIGHSEGALIASVLAADKQLAGVALLAGAATNGKDVLRWQARQIAPTLPKPVKLLMKVLRQDLVRTQMKRLGRIESSTEDVIRIQLVRLNAKWFREFMSFEPANALQHAAVPVLAMTGTKDVQVNPADVALMEQSVPTPFVGHLIEDMTHLLRTEPGTASVRTYKKQARQPLNQQLTDLLTTWVATHTQTKNGVCNGNL
ncbi:MAG: pimeloyl-ACP methyl ester carboxylesterase [Acidimicrobiales bacterium]